MKDETHIPQVSVIIPLYNKAMYIKRALDSVLAQTVQDFEVIVVGGKSTDGGEKIVDEYTDSRIRLILETGKGVSAARNQGVDAAKAELVAFLDADDEWLPEYLETILRLRRKWSEAGLYTTNWYWERRGKVAPRTLNGINDEFEGIIPSLLKVAALNQFFPGFTSSTAIPKKIYLEMHGFRDDLTMGEDIDLWARISLYYLNAHSSKPLSIYHNDDQNSLTRNDSLRLTGTLPFEQLIIDMLDDGLQNIIPSKDELIIYLEQFNISRANSYVALGDMHSARKELLKIKHKDLFSLKWKYYVRTFIPKSVYPSIRRIYDRFSKSDL